MCKLIVWGYNCRVDDASIVNVIGSCDFNVPILMYALSTSLQSDYNPELFLGLAV